MLVHKYVDRNDSAAMLAAKRLTGVAPEVNLREYTLCMSLSSVNGDGHSGFETQRRHHQMSKKQGCQWLKKGYMTTKKF